MFRSRRRPSQRIHPSGSRSAPYIMIVPIGVTLFTRVLMPSAIDWTCFMISAGWPLTFVSRLVTPWVAALIPSSMCVRSAAVMRVSFAPKPSLHCFAAL